MFGRLIIGLLVTVVVADPGQERQGLAIIEVSENRLEGEYRGSLGSIRFIVTSREGNQSLRVSNIEGEPIIASNKLGDTSMHMMTMTMGNTKFLTKMNEPGSGLSKYSDYVVPTALHDHVEEALSNNHVSNVLIQYLDGRNSDMARKEAVENLVLRGEADLIVEAAEALGNAGVMGTESPAAQKFYVLAMRLKKIKDLLQSQAESNRYHPIPHSFTPNMYSRHPQKRASCSECTTGECPYRGDRSRNCHGMCGIGCFCWSWVCGDCCVHKGCLEHDDCCVRYGYFSIQCGDPFSFSCSGHDYSC